MDARIEAAAAVLTLSFSPKVKVTTTKVDLPVLMLASLFNPASVLAPLMNQGNSVTAVAPDHIIERMVSALAIAA